MATGFRCSSRCPSPALTRSPECFGFPETNSSEPGSFDIGNFAGSKTKRQKTTMKPGKIAHAAGRIGNQQGRINEGVKSGELTKKEANKLDRKESKLTRMLMKDTFDGGGFTPKEAAKFERKQDKLSEKINGNKHDKQTNNTPVADKRADKLQSRIDKGISSGELTEAEAGKLQAKLDTMEQAITDAKADGKVTRGERKDLERSAVALSVRTLINKHDEQTG
jgi:hypothetical protein